MRKFFSKYLPASLLLVFLAMILWTCGGGGSSSTATPVPDINVTDSMPPDNDLQVPFGNVLEGDSSDQTVTVTNAGTDNLVIGTVASADALAAPFSILSDTCSGQTLAPSANCTITVQFAPPALGAANDTFDIPCNDPDENPVTVDVSGTGTAIPVPDITVTDSVPPGNDTQVPFDNVLEGTSSDQTVTVTNDGTADLVIGTVASADALAAPFSIPAVTDGCSGMTLAPSASCTITVQFAPTASGDANDTFDIPSDDPDEDPVTVAVSGVGIAPLTFSGSVSGTLVLAVDENGTVAAKDNTFGKTPDAFGNFPFSLTVLDGHDYTIYFVVTAEDRIVPLFSETSPTTNIFSVTGGGNIDLGFVDTTQAVATAENDPLANAGVTDGGATGPNTITLQNSNPILILIERSDVGKKYRTQVQVKNPDGSALIDGALVKDVVMYGPDWQELPLDGSFYYWDGLSRYRDSGSGPEPNPYSDIEVYLAASPGDLSDGFYTEVITDSNRNLHLVKLYFEQPTEVGKPTNLEQFVNPDSSITLFWTNPAGITGPEYRLTIDIQHRDENGDGFPDRDLGVGALNSSTNSYTVPAWFVSSNLAGKQELEWRVRVQQRTDLILFPDGTSRNTQIYRNYSADTPLSLTPPTAIPFTTEMLSGKAFFEENFLAGGGYVSDLSIFNADFSFVNYTYENPPDTSNEDTGTWSLDASGNLILTIAGQGTVTVMLLADSSTEMEVLIDDGTGTPFTVILEKTVPVDSSKVPGTYTDGSTWTFNANGTGSTTGGGGWTFDWSVDSGILKNVFSNGYQGWFYARASSQSTATSYTLLNVAFVELDPSGGFYNYYGGIDLTRQ